MTSGSTPAKAKDTIFIFMGRPSSRAKEPEAIAAMVAPSVRGEALPAVTLPWGLNGVLSVARPSIVVSGRRPSSSLARP